MTILTVLLTVFLIVDCLLLSLLVIIQLPKKEAGAGLAFGGGASDALFGAGSGTALSNLTKYTATAFFILVFVLSVAVNHSQKTGVSDLKRQLEKQSALPSLPPSTPTTAPESSAGSGTAPIALTISSNSIVTGSNAMSSKPASNAPAK